MHRHFGSSGSCAIVRGRPVPGRPGFRIEAEMLAAKLRTAAVSIGRRQEGQRKIFVNRLSRHLSAWPRLSRPRRRRFALDRARNAWRWNSARIDSHLPVLRAIERHGETKQCRSNFRNLLCPIVAIARVVHFHQLSCCKTYSSPRIPCVDASALRTVRFCGAPRRGFPAESFPRSGRRFGCTRFM